MHGVEKYKYIFLLLQVCTEVINISLTRSVGLELVCVIVVFIQMQRPHMEAANTTRLLKLTAAIGTREKNTGARYICPFVSCGPIKIRRERVREIMRFTLRFFRVCKHWPG
jgi:hypothetical protein